MFAFLANNALNTVTVTSSKHMLYSVKGEHCSAIAVIDKNFHCVTKCETHLPSGLKLFTGLDKSAKSLHVLETQL